MSFNCCLPDYTSENDVLVLQLKREVEELMNETTARLLKQDGKIAELCQYIKENLSGTLAVLMDSMKLSGEVSEIITDVVLADVMLSIEQTNVYYDCLETEKLYDETSSCYYYVTKIPKVDYNGKPIKLKLGIANDNEDANTVESTLSFAHRKNATVCINAGVFNVNTHEPLFLLIKDRKILHDGGAMLDDKYQYLAIMWDGSLKTYPIRTSSHRMLNDGAVDVTCIFTTLIDNGVAIDNEDERKEPRQSIGVDGEGNIIIVTCDGRTYVSEGMTYDDLARIHLNLGSVNAYILDGGGSASTVLRGVKQNENIDYNTIDRKVNNFLYIVKDNNVSPDNNASNDLGDVKNFLLERIVNNMDFLKGYLRLRGPENYYAPGIEFYVNAEESRRSKLGLTFDPTNQRNSYVFLSLKGPEDVTEKTNLFRIYPQGTWIQTYHGPSSDRPNGIVGLCYFDETIKKPIWYDGSKWIDATGTAV